MNKERNKEKWVDYLPISFMVGNHLFNVIQYDELYDEDDNYNYGQFDYNNLTININNYNKSVDIPKGNHNYEIVQLGFNVGSSSFTTSTYKASKNYAVRLRYDEYDYNLYYCVDTETYKKSGFTFSFTAEQLSSCLLPQLAYSAESSHDGVLEDF